jgi:hypothetical protein
MKGAGLVGRGSAEFITLPPKPLPSFPGFLFHRPFFQNGLQGPSKGLSLAVHIVAAMTPGR